MDQVKIMVHRFNPAAGEYVQTYTVPLENGKDYSVLNVLDYIAHNLDPTLAYFDHAACRQGACKKCLVSIDGRISTACTEPVNRAGIELKPCGGQVIKDLICGTKDNHG
jgi:succinate dehydrogenase / fumarate reductase iron-sulfur subunit